MKKLFTFVALICVSFSLSANIRVLSDVKLGEGYFPRFIDAETVKTQVKEQAKKQVQETLNNAVSEETKQSIQEAKQTVEKAKTSVNKIKDIFKSDKTKQEELKQQALSKLQSKLNEVLTVPQDET